MNPPWQLPIPSLRRELAVLLALALVGAGLRAWNLGRLGLNHFDEGIYAFAGLWAISPHGLADLDPGLIPYAPPGFVVLVGLMDSLLGVSDMAAILVSILMGSATIVVVGMIGRRVFGAGGGIPAAAIAAFSGPHITFSRMALCDVSFLFFWLVAIWQELRFLERPSGLRAVSMGVAVGLAQLFKYSGWIAGLIVIATAALQMAIARDWSRDRLARVWGWGLVAAAIALLVYAPWILFVENHGGYAALLAHQRGYTGGIGSWFAHFGAQIGQESSLCGGPILPYIASFACVAGFFWAGKGFPTRWLDLIAMIQLLAVANLYTYVGASGWIMVAGLLSVPLFLPAEPLARRILRPTAPLVVGWITLSILTPFYRPYARLWLPLEAFGWLVLGGMVLAFWRTLVETLVAELAAKDNPPASPRPWAMISPDSRMSPRWRAILVPLTCLVLIPALSMIRRSDSGSVIGPADSLRTACAEAVRFLPRDPSRVVILARPSALFYLSMAGVPLDRQGDLAGFSRGADGRSWGIIDAVQLRQEGIASLPDKRLGDGWTVERVVPSDMTLATLFDVDPAAARSPGTGTAVDASAPLYLLKPRAPGTPR